MKNENIIPAVDKALSVIEYMSSAGRPVTQTELCRAAEVTATTGYRIVQSLMKHNWIRKNRGNTYSLSLGMLALLQRSRNAGICFESVQPVLEELAGATKLACKLSIRQWEEQVSVLRAESPEPFSVSGKNGSRFPVIEGSVGAALLLQESEEAIRRLAEGCRVEIPEKNDPELVLRRIAEIRKDGYIFNRGNNRWRVDAMSVPVFDSRKEVVAALTLIGIHDDFTDDNLRTLAAELSEAAAKIEAQI